MSTNNTKAVVLRVADHGESDKIVTFYGQQSGKMAGIAKGAKKSRKRFCNKLEIFSLLDVFYDNRSRSGLVRVVEAELLAPFTSLRENYERYVAGVLACELVYYWSRDNDADRNIFNLLVWALASIDCGKSPELVHIFFQLKLYTILGYRLDLSGCKKCGMAGQAGKPYTFNHARHGLLCRSCSPSFMSREIATLSVNTVKLLQHAQDLPMEKLDRLRFSEVSVHEALTLFKTYGHYLLQREIAAWDFFMKAAGV